MKLPTGDFMAPTFYCTFVTRWVEFLFFFFSTRYLKAITSTLPAKHTHARIMS